jgi:myosin heavy subunit
LTENAEQQRLEVAKKNSQIEALLSEAKCMSEKSEKQEQVMIQMNETIRTMDESKKEMETRFMQQNEALERKNDEVAALSKNRMEIEKKFSLQQQTIEQKDVAVAHLKRQTEEMQSRFKTLDQTLASKTTQLENLQLKSQKVSLEFALQEEELQRTSAELVKKTAEIEKLASIQKAILIQKDKHLSEVNEHLKAMERRKEEQDQKLKEKELVMADIEARRVAIENEIKTKDVKLQLQAAEIDKVSEYLTRHGYITNQQTQQLVDRITAADMDREFSKQLLGIKNEEIMSLTSEVQRLEMAMKDCHCSKKQKSVVPPNWTVSSTHLPDDTHRSHPSAAEFAPESVACDQLLEMGFDRQRILQAITLHGTSDIQGLIDWLSNEQEHYAMKTV